MLATQSAPTSLSSFAGMAITPPAMQATMGGVSTGGDTSTPYGNYKLIRRKGSVVSFEPSKIGIAVTLPLWLLGIIFLFVWLYALSTHPVS